MVRILVLLITIFPIISFGQYLETFSTPNKGILPGACSGTKSSCNQDFSGVNWDINGDFSGMDAGDFFQTDGSGRLNGDGDNDTNTPPGICFETPVLDISGVVGAASFSMDLSWTSWDFTDICNVEYQLDGGAWVQVPPLVGTDGPGTVDFNSDGNTGAGTPFAGGLVGNLLSIRVCLQSNSSFDDIFIDNVSVPEANAMVLPVELVFFSAEKGEDEVMLKWATSSELNNDRFEIEESLDGHTFTKIAEQSGKGNTIVKQEYFYIINNPLRGTSYYRLKQIDFDGQFKYSKAISVNFENIEVGKLYPNPTKPGIVNLIYNAKSNDKISLSIFDVTGKLISSQTEQVSNGKNNLTLNLASLDSGIYIVEINVKDNLTHRKLIIEK